MGGLGDLDGWLDEHGVLDGQPFLLSPAGEYDLALNGYFEVYLAQSPRNTQAAAAWDLKMFLDFLHTAREGCSWRDATADDRAAFQRWRRRDPAGPKIAATSWDRQVSTVNEFYKWAVRRGYLAANPIVQRERRAGRADRALQERWDSAQVPAEASHEGPRRDVEWLPAVSYRRWRDVGIRGYRAGGLPDPGFRGHSASRNAAYADLMVRTGMRLAEQSALSMFELPACEPGALNVRTRLPDAVAKNASGRVLYLPTAVLRDVWDYVELERADAVAQARDRGLYSRIRDPFIVADPARPVAHHRGGRVKVSRLDPDERKRLLIDTAGGLEPAAVWLTGRGVPMDTTGWQEVFKDANARCRRHGVALRCHPHMLRHSYAVITLEQLWRGHLQALGEMNLEQRETYQMVFGDPQNWVRIRLGHRSLTTTQIYLHTLQELEMETRLALIPPDEWGPAGFCRAGLAEGDAA